MSAPNAIWAVWGTRSCAIPVAGHMSQEQSATDPRNRFDISFSSMTLRQGVVEG
jgi:hypothetical protein